ncbi:MAG: hypothetical protein K6G11_01200, partial [Lachnospiraceae bacterium]|nr:hypothetical protein [Lachnospiraceae bacterium]
MANFCNYCGRQLANGEVCNCRNQVAQSNAPQNQMPQSGFNNPQQSLNQVNGMNQNQPMGNQAFNPNPGMNNFNQGMQYGNFQAGYQSSFSFGEFMANVGGVFAHPVTSAKKQSEKKDSLSGILMICFNIVISLIILCIINAVIRSKLEDFAEFFPSARFILLGTLSIAALYFAAAGLLIGFSQIFKGNSRVTFSHCVTPVGQKAMLDSCIFALAGICALINLTFGMHVLVIGMIYTNILMITSFVEISPIPSNRKILVIGITQAIIYIISSIILY